MKILRRLIVLVLGVIMLNSLFAQSALKKANKQYELSDFKSAVISYQDVLDKQPSHLEANSKIADCYRHTNQLEKSIPYYQMAINQQGVNDLYIFQYGLTLQELGRYEQAQQVFDKLVTNSPDYKTRAKQFSDACSYAKSFEDAAMYKVSNEFVNTPGSDFGVAIFKGDRIVFASSRTDIADRNNRSAPSNNSSGNKLFITHRDKNGFLDSPVTLHSGFGNGTNEGPISYAPDGKGVAITKNSFVNGVRQIPSSGQEMTLYLAQVDINGDWSNAVPFQHNVTGFSTGYPAFSTDGNALYFASNRNGGYGGFDLYVSYRTSNSWSVPENLGPAINSIGNEISPFHDGSSLFFASDFHRGFGGFDIFRAEESNGKWATIYHGGSGLNSSADDYGFVYDPVRNFGYFVSNRPGGKGNEDIYRAIKETETVIIKVTDAATGKPIPNATIDFTGCGDKSYSANANGVFNFQVIENLDCQIIIGKDGFIKKALNISSVGLRLNKNLEVALASENSAYRGSVINATNGYFLGNVKIIVTNTRTGEVSETISGNQGDYMVSMLPNSNYLLRFSKQGFVDFSVNFQTSTSDNRLIQNTQMYPVGSAATVSRNEKTASQVPVNESFRMTKTSGYAIQLAAVSSTSVDLSSFQNAVGPDGTVYTIRENSLTKVRAGVYENRNDAERTKSTLRLKGYPGAFIVEETNRELPQSARPVAVKTPESPRPAHASSAGQIGGYMVRIATLSDLKFFDDSNIQDIGLITKVPKGIYTIILLTGYDSKRAAEMALKRVQERGFPEAYIVTEDKGEFRRVQ